MAKLLLGIRPKAGWFALILMIFMSSPAFSQRVIQGRVTSASTGETLPGVNIVSQGTIRGTATDIDGNFTFEVLPEDRILVFSFTGYDEKTIELTAENFYEVTLNEAQYMLEELVVIGYGTVRKSDLTGSVSSLKQEDILKTTASNPVQALQGRATGVQVTTTSGTPGAGVSVRIRGVGTFNDSEPIYVVDGMILSDITFLNNADIASMEVLKDASATAIYGSRGANGVIIIQTNKGKSDMTKPVINFSTEVGLQSLAKKIDLLNGKEFAIISNEIKPGSYNNVDVVPNTDWQDLVFQNALMQSHQFSVAGASEMMDYYFGLGYFKQEGIVPKSDYERISLKLNNTFHLDEHVRIGSNLTIAPYNQQIAPNVTYSVYRAQPLLDPYYTDGSFGVVYNVGNPLADLEYSNNFVKGLRGVGNLYAEADLGDFLLKSSFGIDGSYNKSESFTPSYAVLNPDGTQSQQYNEFSDISKGTSDNLTWLWENTVNYSKQFGIHRIEGVAGFTMQKLRSEEFRLAGQNVIRNESDFWYVLPSYIYDEGNNINMIQNIYNGVNPGYYYNMASLLFRANYTYNDKYILTATFRRDGSSKFSSENRYSNFPSFALGWNAGNEEFMRNVDFISTLKIRASWGKIGNEKISYFDRFARVQSSLQAIFSYPDAPYPAASYGTSGNPDLKWETTTQTDIGLEIGFLNNRLISEFDYFHKTTDDILVELSTPGHLGNGQGQKVRYNAASVLNSGVEMNIRWREKLGDFSYGVGLLGTFLHNEVLSIGGNSGIDSTLIGGGLANGQQVTLSKVGLPIGAFYGYVTDGVFQNLEELDAYPHSSLAEVGDLRFVDVNKDGKINGLDRTYLGSPIPKFIFGINVDLAYKNFDFALDLQGQTGNKIFNGKDVVRPDPYNFERHVWDRWTGEGTGNTEPRASFGGYNYTPSDRFIYNGSYLRVRNIIVGYTLPQKVSESLRLANIRFYMKGSNILTLTKWTGYTPEIGSYDVLSNGIDYGVYPISAVYSVGLNVTF
ncbi:MAG: TonB-dependent receptor [Sphingobacteriia bacterium]|nr:TonB-dependent receptor [Sphingobacteriia bacterium]